MEWQIKADRPIYRQLSEQIELSIISGQYKPGDRLPSVRTLSKEAGVNNNTMQRALQELEREGLLYTIRTTGRFVSQDADLLENLKFKAAKSKITDFLEGMSGLGYDIEEIVDLLRTVNESDENKEVSSEDLFSDEDLDKVINE